MAQKFVRRASAQREEESHNLLGLLRARAHPHMVAHAHARKREGLKEKRVQEVRGRHPFPANSAYVLLWYEYQYVYESNIKHTSIQGGLSS